MTNSDTPQIPAGWYPDPSGTPRTRWWDGLAWTDHYADTAQQPAEALSSTQQAAATAAPYQAQYQPAHAPSQQLHAPEGTSPYTPFIWAFTAVLILPIVGFALFDFTGYMTASMEQPTTVSPLPLLTPSYIALLIAGWASYLLSALFAFLDYRALKNAGVPRPFHWAWTFLSTIVYPIGRSVVVKRRTGSGMLVLWIYIAAYVLYFLVVIIKTVLAVTALMATIPFS
jgi:hypothetical protein